MKTKRIAYWVFTVLFCLMLGGGAMSYFADMPATMATYEGIGFPGWVAYFNGTAKILGIIALLVPSVPAVLKEWAYAGFFYVLVMGVIAHLQIGDGMWMGAAVALVLWAGSYFLRKA